MGSFDEGVTLARLDSISGEGTGKPVLGDHDHPKTGIPTGGDKAGILFNPVVIELFEFGFAESEGCK